jgi:hypothetical protein
MSDFVTWLRGLAEKGGKGVVGNIDARCLGRVADELAELRSEGIESNRLAADNFKRAKVAEAALLEIWKLVHTPTRATNYKGAQDHFMADFDAIRKIIKGCGSSVGIPPATNR